jgi:hypothetical protein
VTQAVLAVLAVVLTLCAVVSLHNYWRRKAEEKRAHQEYSIFRQEIKRTAEIEKILAKSHEEAIRAKEEATEAVEKMWGSR